jgi:general secretion pathway protein D
MTPKVHGIDEMTLDVDAEFKVLGSASFNGIPVISTRKLVSRVRLKNDETAVVAGLMSLNEARSITGLAGLAQIPGLGALVSQRERSKDSGDVVIVLRPHLISLPPDEFVTRTMWVGTESHPLLPL